MNPKTVLIFGVFDGIHDGHKAFIEEAGKEGERLVAIVARDEVVNKLKGKLPLRNEVERIEKLLEVPDVDLVLLGDIEEGTYNVVKEIKPDIIFLGYDQQALSENINKAINEGVLPKIEIMFGQSHKGESLHSSILNNKTNELRN